MREKAIGFEDETEAEMNDQVLDKNEIKSKVENTLTTTSAISTTANNIGNEYINTFPLTLTSCEDTRYRMQDAGRR